MFFDRLDEPIIRFAADVDRGDVEPVVPALGQTWDTRVLVPPQAWGNGYDLPSGKAKLIGHMRNRVYLPRLMRFAQRDPNATGQLVMAGVMHSGEAMGGSVESLRIATLYGDGPSLYGYLGGRPRGSTDATGLFWRNTGEWWRDLKDGIQLGFMAFDTAQAATDLGGSLQAMYQELGTEYGQNLSDDVEWAMDWSRPDEDHSRMSSTWVDFALARGYAKQMNVGYWAETFQSGGSVVAYGGSGNVIAHGGRQMKFTPHLPIYHGGKGRYAHMPNTRKPVVGGRFTEAQKTAMKEANRARNGGFLRDDRTGELLIDEPGHPNSIEFDHIIPKSKGGTNDFANCQIVSRTYNRQKGNRWLGRRPKRNRPPC